LLSGDQVRQLAEDDHLDRRGRLSLPGERLPVFEPLVQVLLDAKRAARWAAVGHETRRNTIDLHLIKHQNSMLMVRRLLLLLRCRRPAGRTFGGGRKRGRSPTTLKLALMVTVALGVGLTLLLGFVWSRRRQQDRDEDEFIENFQNMYD
ncbi:unnamed protein product, partial [Ectocarpus fasciculatus]